MCSLICKYMDTTALEATMKQSAAPAQVNKVGYNRSKINYTIKDS